MITIALLNNSQEKQLMLQDTLFQLEPKKMKVLSLVEIDLILQTLKLLIPEMENGMLFKQIMMNGKMEGASTDVQQQKRTQTESDKLTLTLMS